MTTFCWIYCTKTVFICWLRVWISLSSNRKRKQSSEQLPCWSEGFPFAGWLVVDEDQTMHPQHSRERSERPLGQLCLSKHAVTLAVFSWESLMSTGELVGQNEAAVTLWGYSCFTHNLHKLFPLHLWMCPSWCGIKSNQKLCFYVTQNCIAADKNHLHWQKHTDKLYWRQRAVDEQLASWLHHCRTLSESSVHWFIGQT